MGTTRRIVTWTISGLVTACVIVVAGLFIFSGSIVGPALAPLHLPQLSPATKSARTAAPDGTWSAGSGSVAGFRVGESFLVQSGTIVGRTRAATGSLVIAHDAMSSGSFHIDLSTLTIGGQQNASFFQLLETRTYPNATITLTTPIAFHSLPPTGQTMSSHATGALTMRGITHPVTFRYTARFNGSVLEASGSAPILASDWGIKSPFGMHNNAVIEFVAVLQRG